MYCLQIVIYAMTEKNNGLNNHVKIAFQDTLCVKSDTGFYKGRSTEWDKRCWTATKEVWGWCGIWSIFMPMICSVPLHAKSRDAKAAAVEENSLQIVKIVMIYFFTALTIKGHNRVPSLVDYALMRFDAFRMEVIEIRWAGPLGPRHATF